MIGALISLLITVIILGVLWWAIQQILPLIPLGEPFQTIVRVILVVVMVIICLYIILQLLGAAGLGSPGWRLRM